MRVWQAYVDIETNIFIGMHIDIETNVGQTLVVCLPNGQVLWFAFPMGGLCGLPPCFINTNYQLIQDIDNFATSRTTPL